MVEWINDVPLESPLGEVEKQLGLSLPADLKEVIEKHNKGQPRPNKIPLGDGKTAEFYRLLSFNDGESLSIFECFDDQMKAKKLFPFAMTESGNYICLKNTEVVLYNFAHDAEKHLCDSLSSLLNSLA